MRHDTSDRVPPNRRSNPDPAGPAPRRGAPRAIDCGHDHAHDDERDPAQSAKSPDEERTSPRR